MMLPSLAIGGGLMALASLVPWVTVSSVGPFQSFADLTGIDLGAGYVTLVAGLLTGILALIALRAEPRSTRSALLIVGWAGLLTYAAFWVLPVIRVELLRAGIDVYDYYGRFSHAWGLVPGTIGSIVVVAVATRIRAETNLASMA